MGGAVEGGIDGGIPMMWSAGGEPEGTSSTTGECEEGSPDGGDPAVSAERPAGGAWVAPEHPNQTHQNCL